MPSGQQPRPHDLLWLKEGDIVLQVHDVLFKLEKRVLCAESQFFATMLDLGNNCPMDEGTEGRPLVVIGVTPAAFANTIRIAYDKNVNLGDELTQYADVLHAAHRLQFDQVWWVARHRLDVEYAALPGSSVVKLHAALSSCCGVDNWGIIMFEELALAPRSRFPDISPLHSSVQLALMTLRKELHERRAEAVGRAVAAILCRDHQRVLDAVVANGGRFDEAWQHLRKLHIECLCCGRAFQRHSADLHSRDRVGKHIYPEEILRAAFSRDHEVDLVCEAWQELLSNGDILNKIRNEFLRGTEWSVPCPESAK